MNAPQLPESDIQPADPAARKRAVWFVLFVAVLGGALALALVFREAQINQWLNQNAEILIQQPGIIYSVLFIAMLPLTGGAVYMYRLADRIIRSQRMPPPGQKVIKDTPVITGRKAVRQGRGLKFLSTLMGLIGLLLPFGIVVMLMMLQKSL